MDKRSETKRIMLCTPVLLLGGTEIQMLTLARTLITGGYKVGTCCYYEFDEYVVDQFKEAGAQVFLFNLDRSNGYFGLKKIWELLRKLAHGFEVYKPDIVHVQYLAPGLIPIVAARLAKIPIIFATVHIAGSVVYGRKAKVLLQLASRLCTAFFCVSKGVEEFWFGNSQVLDPKNIGRKRKHFTIYNTVDILKIEKIVNSVDREELKRSLGIADKRVVGIVGRLAPQKGHTALLDAMVKILRKIPDVLLLVIGDGPDRAFLEAKARNLSINQNILWLGSKQQEQVFQLYSIMDIFVMPSLYEGFGLGATEAMAAGIPIVGTKVDGLSEIIEDGLTGYLIPVGDGQELAQALIEMLSDPEKGK